MTQLVALDVAVTLDVADDGLARDLGRVVADLSAGARAPSASVRVLVSGHGPWLVASPAHTAAASTREQAVAAALAGVNLSVLAVTPLLALHACVLTRGEEVLVLPGPSGLGKSTLGAALLLRGWSYVSDEALALDRRSGRLVGYPRPLSLSGWSRLAVAAPDGLTSEAEHVLTAGDLGARVEPQPGPVTVVLLPERGPAPGLLPAARQDALRELVRRGFTHGQDPGGSLQALAELVRGADVGRLVMGGPGDTADLVDATFGPGGPH